MTANAPSEGDEIRRLREAIEAIRKALVEKLRATEQVMRDLEAARANNARRR